jgi:SAM-dependent methyltransferase
MERIYANRPAGRTVRGLLADRITLASPASRAVRHRRLATIEAGRALGPASVLSIPCGGAGDAAAIAAARTVLVDPDPAARALAVARCREAEVVDGTVERAPEGPFDLVLYVGLSEYLNDAAVVAHLQALRARLAPEGALLTTTTAEHPQRDAMRDWLGWETRARSPDQLASLLEDAGFVVTRRVADPFGIQWVLTARLRA